MPYSEVALLAFFGMLYAAAGGRFERSPINGALVFVVFGLFVGPFGFGWIEGNMNAESLRVIAELTLAIFLFIDASKADMKVIENHSALPIRLILLALPLVMVLGFGLAWAIFPNVNILSLALLAVILAPTDAALGKPVVSNKAVPPNLREGLNFESGLNDGVCVPIFLAVLALATGDSEGQTFGELARHLIVKEIGIGAGVGITVAAIAAVFIKFANGRGWSNDIWGQLPVIATAIACFTAAQAMHGSGFIGAFVGGLVFGRIIGHDIHKLIHAGEGVGEALAMVTWVSFGAALVGPLLGIITPKVVLYALLSLTVVRMLPVWLSLRGVGLPPKEVLFVGWFGPRGLATVVFGVMVIQSGLPDAQLIVAVASTAVLLSVILHGISALPVIRRMFGEG